MPPFLRTALPGDRRRAAGRGARPPPRTARSSSSSRPGDGDGRRRCPSGARLGNTIHALGARVVRTSGDPAAAAAALNRRADVEYAEVDRPMQPLRDAERPALPRALRPEQHRPDRRRRRRRHRRPRGLGRRRARRVPVDRRRQGRDRRHRDHPDPRGPRRQDRRLRPVASPGRDHRRRVPRRQRPRHARRGHDHREREQRHAASPAWRSTRRCRSARRSSGPLGQGTTADVASCITWATDRGAKVISMSLGGGPSTTLQNAVRYAAGARRPDRRRGRQRRQRDAELPGGLRRGRLRRGDRRPRRPRDRSPTPTATSRSRRPA